MRHLFQKEGMTSVFDENGRHYGVTVLKLLEARFEREQVLEDGRRQIVVSYFSAKKKEKVVKQTAWLSDETFSKNSMLPKPEFTNEDLLELTGISKGKGFQGVMKRHGFAGGPGSHGSRFHRAVGSVGMRTEPAKTPKGKKMPGRMGAAQVHQKGQKVFYWDSEEGLLAVVGSVPGPRGSSVFVSKQV
jgi:large subunit ribosomal protein L3